MGRFWLVDEENVSFGTDARGRPWASRSACTQSRPAKPLSLSTSQERSVDHSGRRPIAGFKEMLENNERNTETTFPPEHIFTYADLQASRALKACVYCWPAKSDGHGFHPSILDGALPDEQGSA